MVPSDVIYAFGGDGSDYYDGDGSPSTRGALTKGTDGRIFNGKTAVLDIDGDGRMEIRDDLSARPVHFQVTNATQAPNSIRPTGAPPCWQGIDTAQRSKKLASIGLRSISALTAR